MGNLADLEIFSRVVASGSMSAAGRELGLQPAIISKRIKRLEERLGTRLLQRTTRQISLTEAPAFISGWCRHWRAWKKRKPLHRANPARCAAA